MSDTEPSTETAVPTVTPGPCVEKVRETVSVHLKIHGEGTEASSILFVSWDPLLLLSFLFRAEWKYFFLIQPGDCGNWVLCI